jgi:hypothetical protein
LLNKRQRAAAGSLLSTRLEKIQQGRSREETARGS